MSFKEYVFMVFAIHYRYHGLYSMSLPTPLLETVLVASPDGPITAYDPCSGTALARYNGSRCPRNGITLIGDDQFACSHVSDIGLGSIHLYYWWSPTYIRSICPPEPVAPLAATIDGVYLLSGGVSGKIHSVSVPSGDLIRSVCAHEKPVSCIVINGDGSLVISGSDDGSIAVVPIFMLLDVSFDTEYGCLSFNRFVGHELPVTGLTTGMGIMISSSLDWTCKVWCIASGTHLKTVNFSEEILCSTLDPSETELYAAGTNGTIYKRKLKVKSRKEVASGGKMVVWGGKKEEAVVAVKMLKYGQTLLTVSENGEICVWEPEGGKMISSFSMRTGDVSGVVVVKGGGGCFETRALGSEKSAGYGGGKEVSKEVTEVVGMEKALKVVVEDRRRAINNLESTIDINETLMELMLKEAKAIAKFDD